MSSDRISEIKYATNRTDEIDAAGAPSLGGGSQGFRSLPLGLHYLLISFLML